MKTTKSVLSLIVSLNILSCSFFTVSAAEPSDPNAPINTQYSSVTVSAGNSAYTSQTSTTSGNQTMCYMRLRKFQFSGYSENYMPSGKYIYSRLYYYDVQPSPSGPVSSLASFNHTTSPGNYNYSYTSSNGSSGNSYRLKTNSNYSVQYTAYFDWSANAY